MKAERYKMIFKLKKDKNEIYFIGKNLWKKKKKKAEEFQEKILLKIIKIKVN